MSGEETEMVKLIIQPEKGVAEIIEFLEPVYIEIDLGDERFMIVKCKGEDLKIGTPAVSRLVVIPEASNIIYVREEKI